MNEVVWSASLPEFRLLYATPSIQKLTGRPAENLVGKTDWWQSILHPSELESIAEISHQLKSKGRCTSRNRIIRPNGSHLRVHMSGKVVFNEANEPIRVDGVMVDRTHHHEAETALINEVRFQKVLIDISTTYINLDTDQLDAAIQNSLSDLGSFVNADRAYVFQYDFKANTTSNTHEWCREGIEPEINNLQDVPIEAIPFWLEKHKKGEPLYVPDVSRLPNSGDYSLRAILEPQGIKSLITLPMLDGNELLGFVGFDYVNDYYEYSERERKLLFVFVQMLINIRKRQLNERIIAEQESKFTNLIDTMNLGLIEVDGDGRIAYVNSGFLQLSGWKQHELAGKRFKSLEKKVTISVPVSGAQHLAE
jgi:PAS domain S-box-containing protein